MNRGEVIKAGALLQEYLRDKSALDNFEKGGRILSLEVASDLPAPREGVPPPFIKIMTQQVEFPPELLEGIKKTLRDRLDELAKELDDLGITGLDQERGPAGPQTAAPAPAARKKGKAK